MRNVGRIPKGASTVATLANTIPISRREIPRPPAEMIGSSIAMRRALNAVDLVAPTNSAVLIQEQRSLVRQLETPDG